MCEMVVVEEHQVQDCVVTCSGTGLIQHLWTMVYMYTNIKLLHLFPCCRFLISLYKQETCFVHPPAPPAIVIYQHTCTHSLKCWKHNNYCERAYFASLRRSQYSKGSGHCYVKSTRMRLCSSIMEHAHLLLSVQAHGLINQLVTMDTYMQWPVS